jgi:hypothetical protein
LFPPPSAASSPSRHNRLLVDGHVAGVWRAVEEGIEAAAFHRLSDEAWTGLATEAASSPPARRR